MSLRSRLRRLIPTREQLQAGRFTRWLAPFLGHAKLWHWSRRGVAAGVAVGIFFGLLVPIAQIPLSVGAAIVMGANVPAAVSSTLVSNPLTFAPIYYLAYRTGLLVTGDEVHHPERELARITARADADEARAGGVRGVVERVRALGKPLIIGLAIFAVAGGLLAYVLIWAGWWLWVHRKRRRKVARYARARSAADAPADRSARSQWAPAPPCRRLITHHARHPCSC